MKTLLDIHKPQHALIGDLLRLVRPQLCNPPIILQPADILFSLKIIEVHLNHVVRANSLRYFERLEILQPRELTIFLV